MGMREDNYVVGVHRRRGWDGPEVFVQHHHGVRNIDRRISLTVDQARGMRSVAHDAGAFAQVMAAMHPAFSRDVGADGIEVVRQLLLDLASL